MTRPLVIAFLACNKNPARYRQDASFVYRCENLALALAGLGHEIFVGHLNDCPAQRFDGVVLHRPRLTWRLRWWLPRWRRQRTRVIADVDDLIFLPDLASASPGVLNRLVSEGEIRTLFCAHWRALQQVDRVSVSTAPLRDELQAAVRAQGGAAPPIAVLPNAVHWRWRGLPATPMQATPPLISYLPGTRSHDRDFALVAPALQQVLRRHPEVRIEVTGPGHFPLDLPDAQILRLARHDFAFYPDVVRRAHVNLLPLEPTRFNRCKTALKVLEAGFWQIPTLCSPLADARRFEGAGAWVANSETDWSTLLERLLSDAPWYRQQTQGLRERVLAQADIHAVARAWLDFVLAPKGSRVSGGGEALDGR